MSEKKPGKGLFSILTAVREEKKPNKDTTDKDKDKDHDKDNKSNPPKSTAPASSSSSSSSSASSNAHAQPSSTASVSAAASTASSAPAPPPPPGPPASASAVKTNSTSTPVRSNQTSPNPPSSSGNTLTRPQSSSASAATTSSTSNKGNAARPASVSTGGVSGGGAVRAPIGAGALSPGQAPRPLQPLVLKLVSPHCYHTEIIRVEGIPQSRVLGSTFIWSRRHEADSHDHHHHPPLWEKITETEKPKFTPSLDDIGCKIQVEWIPPKKLDPQHPPNFPPNVSLSPQPLSPLTNISSPSPPPSDFTSPEPHHLPPVPPNRSPEPSLTPSLKPLTAEIGPIQVTPEYEEAAMKRLNSGDAFTITKDDDVLFLTCKKKKVIVSRTDNSTLLKFPLSKHTKFVLDSRDPRHFTIIDMSDNHLLFDAHADSQRSRDILSLLLSKLQSQLHSINEHSPHHSPSHASTHEEHSIEESEYADDDDDDDDEEDDRHESSDMFNDDMSQYEPSLTKSSSYSTLSTSSSLSNLSNFNDLVEVQIYPRGFRPKHQQILVTGDKAKSLMAVQIKRLLETNRTLEKEYQMTLASREAEADSARSSLSKIANERDNAAKFANDTKKEAQSLRAQIAKMEGRDPNDPSSGPSRDQLESMLKKLQAENRALRMDFAKHQQASARVESLEEANMELASQAADWAKKYEFECRARADLEKKMEKYKQLEGDLASKEKEIKEIKRARAEYEDRRRAHEELLDKYAQLENEKNAISTKLSTTQATLTNVENERNQLQQDKESLIEQIKSLNNKCEEISANRNYLKKKAESLSAQVARHLKDNNVDVEALLKLGLALKSNKKSNPHNIHSNDSGDLDDSDRARLEREIVTLRKQKAEAISALESYKKAFQTQAAKNKETREGVGVPGSHPLTSGPSPNGHPPHPHPPVLVKSSSGDLADMRRAAPKPGGQPSPVGGSPQSSQGQRLAPAPGGGPPVQRGPPGTPVRVGGPIAPTRGGVPGPARVGPPPPQGGANPAIRPVMQNGPRAAPAPSPSPQLSRQRT